MENQMRIGDYRKCKGAGGRELDYDEDKGNSECGFGIFMFVTSSNLGV